MNMCGQKVTAPLYVAKPVDRQRDFGPNVSKPSACRIFYNGKLDPRSSPHTESNRGPAGKHEVNQNRRNRNLLYHDSLDAMMSQKQGDRWFEQHHQAKFKRLFHAATDFPKDLERKIWLLTGGDRTTAENCIRTGLPAVQTSRQACPPTRTLLERRMSIDLSILKLKVFQKLVAVYQLLDDSRNGDLNLLEFTKAVKMMKLKPFTAAEIRRDLNDRRVMISINFDQFRKLVAKRIMSGTSAEKVKKHNQLLNVLDRFEALNADLAPMGDPGEDQATPDQAVPDPDFSLLNQDCFGAPLLKGNHCNSIPKEVNRGSKTSRF